MNAKNIKADQNECEKHNERIAQKFKIISYIMMEFY